jgi:hypothetical protein
MPATRHIEGATAIPEAMTAAVDTKKQSRTRSAPDLSQLLTNC